MNFFKKIVFTSTALLLPSSSVCASSIINPNISIMAKAMVNDRSYVSIQNIPFLQEWNPTSEQERGKFEIYVSVLENSGLNFSNNFDEYQTIRYYSEFRFVINCIKSIVWSSLEYAHSGTLDNIVNNMSLDLLTSNNLNLLKMFSSTIAFSPNRGAILDFDTTCFKNLMRSNHDLWLSSIYDEYKNSNDDISTYNKIKGILDFQYQYLIAHPNYLAGL